MLLRDLAVTHKTAVVNGIRIRYVEKGKGPLVLLLHGFPESWWSWRYQIDPLVNAGFRVIAPDQRGYADSDKQGPYDLDTLAADMCGLIDAAGQGKRAIVVGHDWGGGVAWHLAATRPEHCARLVVMNCPHPVVFKRALTSSWSQLKKSWYMFFFQLPILPERMLTRDGGEGMNKMYLAMAKDSANFSREELAPITESTLRPGAASGMLAWYRTALTRGLRDRKTLGRYPIIEAPTMLIWAKDDLALGYEQCVPGTERWVRDLRVVPIERCGHFVQAEQPAKVNEVLLSFLASSRAEASPAG